MSIHWFPPVNDPNSKACLLKWSQVSLYLWENTSSSCHRNKNAVIPDSYDFHNTEPVLIHRQKMLNGNWPSDGRGCEHCRDQEIYGDMSDRQQWLQNDYNKKFVPKELLADPKATHVRPTMLSVHFNNKCNLKCVYCGPNLSSSWVKEVMFYDEGREWNIDPWTIESGYKDRLAKFYRWMDENYSSLKSFDILGGEPFIQTETFDCLDWMIEHPNPELDFEIYSNMTVKPDLFKRGMEKLKRVAATVHNVDFTASIDTWGPATNYIRNGINLDYFEENMNYLVHECPEITPTMNWTVSSLSIPYTAELIKKVIEWNKTRYVSVNYNKCVDPAIYDPSIFPAGTFTKHIEEIIELNKLMYKRPDGDFSNSSFLYSSSVFKEIDSSPARYDKIKELIEMLDKLDPRRNTNWQETFPWLDEIVRNFPK